MIAITRDVSDAIVQCELTHLTREPIDVERARAQHDDYEHALHHLGCDVHRLSADATMPDSVFIEDVAIVLDELAILTRPGAESRRVETAAVAEVLKPYRRLVAIEAPGTIDGGDVLVVGRTIFVGLSRRTNKAAVEQLRAATAHAGYDVQPRTVHGCLHLKSAVTAIADDVLLLNPEWAARDAFPGFDHVEVDSREPAAANIVRVSGRLLFPSSFPRTRERIEKLGFAVTTVDVSELAKAEGAVTCCSLLINRVPTRSARPVAAP